MEEHPEARAQDEAPAANNIDDDHPGHVHGVDDEIEQPQHILLQAPDVTEM